MKLIVNKDRDNNGAEYYIGFLEEKNGKTVTVIRFEEVFINPSIIIDIVAETTGAAQG